jgi:hypothetical protein
VSGGAPIGGIRGPSERWSERERWLGRVFFWGFNVMYETNQIQAMSMQCICDRYNMLVQCGATTISPANKCV